MAIINKELANFMQDAVSNGCHFAGDEYIGGEDCNLFTIEALFGDDAEDPLHTFDYQNESDYKHDLAIVGI